jgi:hypothetical protein
MSEIFIKLIRLSFLFMEICLGIYFCWCVSHFYSCWYVSNVYQHW